MENGSASSTLRLKRNLLVYQARQYNSVVLCDETLDFFLVQSRLAQNNPHVFLRKLPLMRQLDAFGRTLFTMNLDTFRSQRKRIAQLKELITQALACDHVLPFVPWCRAS